MFHALLCGDWLGMHCPIDIHGGQKGFFKGLTISDGMMKSSYVPYVYVNVIIMKGKKSGK